MKIEKTQQGLAKNISKDLLTICNRDIHLAKQQELEDTKTDNADDYARAVCEIQDKYNLVKREVQSEWVQRCVTPEKTKMELSKTDSLEKACETLSPSLFFIRNEKGDKYVLAYIKMWFIDLQMSLNIKNKLTEQMINTIAERVFTTFGYLTIADIKNVFTWALEGRYGEYYESLSIPKIFGWFESYFNDRCAYFEAKNFDDHYYEKSEASGWKIGERTKVVLSDVEKGMVNGK